MGWSREGARMAAALAPVLAAEPLAAIVHSGALRTRRLAQMVARRAGLPLCVDPRWMERDFGSWEGRSWNAIWRKTGSLMDRMMTHPQTFQPGGGETSQELMDRVRLAWNELSVEGDALVVAHGGSIAAIRTALQGFPPERMVEFIPKHGEIITINPCQSCG